MKCEFTEKVSALIDGELLQKEAREIEGHIENCDECAASKDDFLFMRQQIKGLAIDERTSASAGPSFLHRRISIPAPAFVVALLLAAGIISTLVLFVPRGVKNNAQLKQPEKIETKKASLARYDNGGKAQIYKEARR